MFIFENILLSIIAVCNIGLAIFINSRSKKDQIGFLFSLFVVFMAYWAIVLVAYSLVTDDLLAIYLMKSSYVSALIIGISFYYFASIYPNERSLSRTHQTLVVAPVFLFVICLLLFPTFFTKEIVLHEWGKETVLGLPEYLIFVAIFIGLFCGGLAKIWLKFLKSSALERAQLFLISTSVTIAGMFGMYFNLYLPSPFLQDFRYIWTGPLFTFVIAVTITYSIFRFKLFNLKTLATELFTFILWVFILVQFFLATNMEQQITNGILLIGTVIIGLFLVRSVKREVEQKQLAQRLATELAGANARLERLDKTKSEFVSIASHQLRSPLTSIRGYVSMVLEGTYGEISPKAKEVLQHVRDSSRHMATSIDDYLNISRIEAGNMKYDLADLNLRKVVEDIVSDMQAVAVERGIPLTLKSDFEGPATVKLDEGKVRQIIQNLIDNAFKYTKEKGVIEITLRKDVSNSKVFVDVKDQGIGLSAEGIANLFEKFGRAKNANTTNVSGSGLGLYIARTMARAMEGDIIVTSPGEGKGSTFTVSFLLNGIEAKWNSSK